MAELHASETAVYVTDEAIQILGGNGYTREYPVERMHRDAKIFTIFEAPHQRDPAARDGARADGTADADRQTVNPPSTFRFARLMKPTLAVQETSPRAATSLTCP